MSETMTKAKAANVQHGPSITERRNALVSKTAELDQKLASLKTTKTTDAVGFFSAKSESEVDDVQSAIRITEIEEKSVGKKLSLLESAIRGLDVAERATDDDRNFIESHRDDVLRILRLNPRGMDRAKAMRLIREAQTS